MPRFPKSLVPKALVPKALVPKAPVPKVAQLAMLIIPAFLPLLPERVSHSGLAHSGLALFVAFSGGWRFSLRRLFRQRWALG
ncbi:MAG: hypothetical protein Fur0046_24710 [Cyanobacteria bacterium J069]